MLSKILLRCFLEMVLMHMCRRAKGNKTIPTSLNCDCTCLGLDDKTYNFAPLARDSGKPRFTATDAHGVWSYSYNPCLPFSLGWPPNHGCDSDVAICRWKKNKSSFKTIGKQSQAHCILDGEYMIPTLVYTNKELFPDRSAVLHLKCDQSRKTGDAKFDFLGVEDGNWKFLLTSVCSCPNGCVHEPTSPGPTGAKYPMPVIGALSFLVIAIPLFIYRRTIWRCIRRQNDPNNERQALNPGNIRNDYAANDNIDGADLRIQPHSSSENRTWASNNSNSARDNYSRGYNRSHNTDL